MSKAASGVPADKLALYEKLVATNADVERKGAGESVEDAGIGGLVVGGLDEAVGQEAGNSLVEGDGVGTLGAGGVGEVGDGGVAAEVAGVAVEDVEADVAFGEAEVLVAGSVGGRRSVHDGAVEFAALFRLELVVEGGFEFEFFGRMCFGVHCQLLFLGPLGAALLGATRRNFCN